MKVAKKLEYLKKGEMVNIIYDGKGRPIREIVNKPPDSHNPRHSKDCAICEINRGLTGDTSVQPREQVHHVERPGTKERQRRALLVAAAIVCFTIALTGLVGIIGVLRIMGD